ncbi:MAG TPA: ABC transporter permease [Candidatus Nanoarchaeia archaeon]|nr:ABC transporter permease [Candidatus Nanoarchaeia archaeon]
MKSLWLLTKKNLKLLVRSKTSALVVFFAPLFIILLLGLSYNSTSKYGLNIGVYAPSFSSDVESLISSLQEQEFKIVKYNTAVDDCVKDIKAGVVHACVSVPESLTIDGNQQKEVSFFVDPSKVNLVGVIQDTLNDKFNLKSQQISKELSGNLLTAVSDTKSKLEEQGTQLSSAKEKSAAASTTTLEVSQQLSTLDLTIPTLAYDPQLIVNFKTSVSPKIKSGLADVKDARTAVESSSLEDKSAILSSLSKVEVQLKSLDTLVNGVAVSTNNNTTTNSSNTTVTAASTSFLGALTLLEDELTNTKGKLTAAATAIETTSTGLSSTTQNLQDSVSALEAAQQRVNEMKANLDGQKVTDANVLSAPLVTKIEKVAQEGSYLNYMFPALLVLVVMFSSLLLGTTLVMMEKNSPAFFRNYFLPIKKGTFVVSTYLTTMVITLIQVVIILGVSIIFLKISPLQLLPVAGALLLSSSVFSFMGMGLGYMFKSEETGTLASISTGSLMLFVSGVVLPLETISPAARNIISHFNPFVLSESVIREVFIFNAGFSSVWVELATLAGYAVGLLVVILTAEYLVHKHFISGFMKHRHLKHRQQEKRDKNNV